MTFHGLLGEHEKSEKGSIAIACTPALSTSSLLTNVLLFEKKN
ncbi:MAG: hypothetical protein QNJ54_27730 [Prochloraceae cyanobacterium]|nr:hypothetical protein [Prochloraceae cyanobacterium]